MRGTLASYLKSPFRASEARRLFRAARLHRAQHAHITTRCRISAGSIRDRKRVATCLGFGPRFLHSTGQAYKGGPNSGVFLQITCDDADDLAGARPEIHLWRRQGGAGARRFRGAGRTWAAGACVSISGPMSRQVSTTLKAAVEEALSVMTFVGRRLQCSLA